MEVFEMFLAAAPYLIPLIEKGFTVISPNGMTIKTVADLEIINERIRGYKHLTPEPGVLEEAWKEMFGTK